MACAEEKYDHSTEWVEGLGERKGIRAQRKQKRAQPKGIGHETRAWGHIPAVTSLGAVKYEGS